MTTSNSPFEQHSEIPFLDIVIKRHHNNSFSTSIYRKKTFTDLYTKWDSFTTRKYKTNLIRTLTYRCFRICSSASLLQSTILAAFLAPAVGNDPKLVSVSPRLHTRLGSQYLSQQTRWKKRHRYNHSEDIPWDGNFNIPLFFVRVTITQIRDML